MDQANVATQGGRELMLAKKSWTAYVGLGFLGLVLLFIVVPVIWGSSSIWIGAPALIVTAAFVIYKFLVIKSVLLYCDEDGIWLYSGILPWNKGVRGVKWRDLDEAVYFQGMGSWLFKSYTMRIGHRFTKSSEIILSHMRHGHEAVAEINTRHQDLVRNNLLT